VTAGPRRARIDVAGGDPLGHGDQPRLSWRLPEGATTQSAYHIVSDDGYDSGWINSDRQLHIEVPLFDRPRRATNVAVRVRTELGESGWSRPVAVHSGLADRNWTAEWIGVDEPQVPPKGARPAYWLRRVVKLSALDGARLYASALGLYEVYLNGVRVGNTELAPGYTQYQARVQYQTYDVGAMLRKGSNVIAVLLADGWYRGQVGVPRAADQFGAATALRLQLEVPDGTGWWIVASTGDGWRGAASHIGAADLIAGQSEDLRLVDPAIHDPAYDDKGWSAAVRRSVDIAVVRTIFAPVRQVETVPAVSATPLPGGAFIVDLGRNINGWARLRNLGPAGTRLTLRHGEHLDAGGDLTTTHLDVNLSIVPEPLPVGQVDRVISAGRAEDVFEPRFTTHGFRYLRIDGHPGGLHPSDVDGVVVHSDLRRTGWFDCSDERLNRLHDAVVWSLRGNMCAIPTDCPQRERAGWTGDWQVFAATAAYLYDVLGFTRSWLRDVALDQRDDGCVANISPCPPAEGFESPLGALNGSAGWGDAVVSVPWDLYQAYGDESLLRENWPVMRRWVDYAATRAALGRHPARVAARAEPAEHEKWLWDNGFHWGEWLEPGFELTDFGAFAAADKSEVATAYLCRSAGMVADIGEVLGADVAHYRDLAAGALRAWQAEFLHADGTLAVQTQASHVRALAFGLVPDELRASVSARLVELIEAADTHLTTGFLSTGLLLPVLADTGHLDTAFALLQQDTEPSWLTMIDRGATTIWERWNGVDAQGVAHESLNHYSKGAVASFLHRYVGGLRPTAPGYRRFDIRPRPGGGITSATVRHDSPYGPIEFSWQVTGTSFSAHVGVPAGTVATVWLPGASPREVGPGLHAWPD
jgi:alpha-L-rhamnosidase